MSANATTIFSLYKFRLNLFAIVSLVFKPYFEKKQVMNVRVSDSMVFIAIFNTDNCNAMYFGNFIITNVSNQENSSSSPISLFLPFLPPLSHSPQPLLSTLPFSDTHSSPSQPSWVYWKYFHSQLLNKHKTRFFLITVTKYLQRYFMLDPSMLDNRHNQLNRRRNQRHGFKCA